MTEATEDYAGGTPTIGWLPGALAWALLAAAAVAVGLLAFAGKSWPGDMAAFFRPQIAVATGLLLLCAVALRRRRLAAAFGVLLLLSGAPLFLSGVPRSSDASHRDLRIVSANLLYDNPDKAGFHGVVAGLAPDILVTQEAKFGWPEALRTLPGLPHMAGPEVSRWNGNIVLSRYPMRAQLMPDMPPSGDPIGGAQAIRVELMRPDAVRPLVLYAVHAPTPRPVAGWRTRNLYLDTLARRIAAEPPDIDLVMAGDWNTPVWTPAFRDFFEISQLLATERSAWPSATRVFFGLGKLLGTAVDHVAVSRGIGVAGIFTGGNFGSDHLPVVVDLALPEGG